MSTGSTVQKSVITDERVYKQVWSRGLGRENCIEIEEYKITGTYNQPANHPSKLLRFFVYSFSEGDLDELQVK